MRIEIEIPKEFEPDYVEDKFKDFFSRVLADIKTGDLCGRYEREITEMFIKAFKESKEAYDVEAAVAALEVNKNHYMQEYFKSYEDEDKGRYIAFGDSIDIVRNGGKE